MVLFHRLFALPPALLALVLERSTLGQSKELEWPYNLPAHVKYYPEDEGLVKRNVEIRQRLQQQSPVGMKKMSGDPGEMFFLDYWRFKIDDHDSDGGSSNISEAAELTAPLKLHVDSIHQRSVLPRFLGHSLFDKRGFTCPAGSAACTSINRPNSCCKTGSTCQLVQDVGLGDVGCCAENQVCGGSVSTCPANYISCPQNPGGGCCIPGYACFNVGCVATSTAVVVIVPSTTTTSRTLSTSAPPPASPSTATQTETQTQVQTQTQTQVQTQTQTQTQVQTDTRTIVPVPVPIPSTSPPITTTDTTTASTTATTATTAVVTTTTTENTITTTTTSSSSQPNTLVCSSGFRSCPASLGGGCCPTDRACGSDVCPALSSTNSFVAPARPTSNSVDGTTTSTATGFTTIPGAECPTGFYACSAFYQGGCCQTGRDCQPTSCPPGASITVVDGSSITIDAPTRSGISSVTTLLTGSCASGWSTCAMNVGGGCCPSGYACGTACTATATGGQGSVVGKIAPNEGGKAWDTQKIWILMGSSLISVAVLFGYFA